MEFFLPSILFLLVACGIVFFVIPRFGPLVLAGVSLVLLGLGIYNHYSMFATEYRLSTWQSGMIGYAPFIMIGALVLAILLYLFYLVPAGSNNNNTNLAGNRLPTPNRPTINLPPPGTATNAITEGIGNMMRKAAEAANVNVRNQMGSPNRLPPPPGVSPN
jgi:hypothetical protein